MKICKLRISLIKQVEDPNQLLKQILCRSLLIEDINIADSLIET